MEYQIPKGLYDILPFSKEEFKLIDKWQYLESVIFKLAEDYNYEEIRTPIFEKTELFVRGVGETSDIASKELYTFLDKAKRSMSLRPEGTASIMRSFIENSLNQHKKLNKFFYIGPMFRYDRPQAGRYRQFYQFGIEVIGKKSPEIDVETIDMLINLFKRLELKNLKLIINSLGDADTRKNYKKALLEYLKPSFEKLSKDSKERFEKNPLRILDSKESSDKELLINAPKILDFLSDEAKDHFEKVKDLLEKLSIEYVIDTNLVRGLDYYDDTVFEVVSHELGSQNSLGGGGRFNTLLKSLNGPDLPGVGFACGMERILQTMIKQEVYFPQKKAPFLFIIPTTDKAKEFAFILTKELRHHKIPTDIDLDTKKIQKSIGVADKIGAENILILAEDEMTSKKATYKNLKTREQVAVDFDNLKTFIKDKYYKLKGKL
ncbi:MAG: histidine--tRNA ligase [Parachlamydiales bacterium]|nr:histidine--tRNA ligase [Parachlamydiales bacterium]